jgi:hypothetical protein
LYRPDRRYEGYALWLAAGANPEALAGDRARHSWRRRFELAAPGEIREVSLRAFDRTFAVTYALASPRSLSAFTACRRRSVRWSRRRELACCATSG